MALTQSSSGVCKCDTSWHAVMPPPTSSNVIYCASVAISEAMGLPLARRKALISQPSPPKATVNVSP